MTKLRIFVASPGDVSQERDIVSVVVQELRRTIGDIRNVELEAIRWETHAWPAVGKDAQNVINTQIGEYDVLVGVMWKRFGTPTKHSNSGTGEEFELAYDYFTKYQRPKIMFYFRTAPFYTTNEKELSQFRKVVRFRKKLEKLGVLFWEYAQPLEPPLGLIRYQWVDLFSPDGLDKLIFALRAAWKSKQRQPVSS
jgi:hypothetical protein